MILQYDRYEHHSKTANHNYTVRYGSDNLTEVSGKISAWEDLGSDSADGAQTDSADRPAYSADGINGKPTVNQHSGSNEALELGTESDWQFLVNKSTDYTLVAVVSVTSDGSGNDAILVNHGNTFCTNGFMLVMDAGSDRLRVLFRDAGSTVVNINATSSTVSDGDLCVICFRCDVSTDCKLDYLSETSPASIVSASDTIHSTAITATVDQELRMQVTDGGGTGKEIMFSDVQVWKELKSDEWAENTLKELFTHYKDR